jgi:2-polyprenyl-3-methyl-5-hydroxy-6-metoxy-1,4-benzoquinol methylase
MQTDILESVGCNLCGRDDFEVIYAPQYDHEKDADVTMKFRASGDETLIDQVVRCKSCDLIYVNPRLREEVIIQGYAEGSDEQFISQAYGRELTFDRSLKYIEKFAPRKGRLLDIGTAGGSFLYVARRRGWEVHGCEPNRWLCEWGKKHYGLEISPGTLFDQYYIDGTFEVVTLWDVLEHTPDPKNVITECNRILRTGGVLVVNYPDIGSWIARAMGRKWVFLLSVHLYYFTRPTIRKMLELSGFEILAIKPHLQRLSLGYIFRRAKAYVKPIGVIGERVAEKLGMQDWQMPYWIGQTLVIARKAGGSNGKKT